MSNDKIICPCCNAHFVLEKKEKKALFVWDTCGGNYAYPSREAIWRAKKDPKYKKRLNICECEPEYDVEG